MNVKGLLVIAISIVAHASSAWAADSGGYSVRARYGAYSSGGSKEMADRNLSLAGTADIPGFGAQVPVTTAGAVGETILKKNKVTSFGVNFVTPIGIGIGLTQTTDLVTKAWNTKSVLATSVNATGTPIHAWAPSGTQLIQEDLKATVDYLDLSYSLRGPVGLTIGGGVPVAGKSTIGVTYGPEASALISAATGAAPTAETLSVKAKSGYAAFADLSFGLGPVELLVGYRYEHAKGSVDISKSPVRLLAGQNSIDAETNISLVNAGIGLHF